jgi:hypothetical protein
MTGFELIVNLATSIKNNKMMKTILLTVFLMFTVVSGYSQTVEEIRGSKDYISGIGQGATFQEADKNALDMLISQITVRVESDFVNIVQERGDSLKQFSKSVVKTYSNVTLQQAKSKLVSEVDGKFEVLRYLPVADLNDIFERRKNKIIDYVQTGINAEKEVRIGDALRNYYWALVLLRTHPQCDKIRFNFGSKGELLLMTALPDCINRLFSGISITIKKQEFNQAKKEKSILLDIEYNKQPVQNFDFVYWTGDSYSNQISTTDGIAMVDFMDEVGCSLSSLKIIAEYAYANKTRWDSELQSVFDNSKQFVFDRAHYKYNLSKNGVSLDGDAGKGTETSQSSTQLTNKSDSAVTKGIQAINNVENLPDYKDKVEKVVSAIKNGKTVDSSLFTPEGLKMYNSLITNAKIKVIDTEQPLRAVKVGDRVEVRSVPMRFCYKNNQREFIENVSFSFDKTSKLDGLSFNIGSRTLSDITSLSENFGTTENKFQIIQFLENFKTAYALKRLDYLESVFADNALIIVGHVFEKAEPIDKMYNVLGEGNVKYVRLTKGEYLANLKTVFNSAEFVNLQFEETRVSKINGQDKVYGIQLEQHYFSSSYTDKGYLFLMIDLRDTTKPKIYVRTWQPKKNPDGSIFGLQDFHF